MELLIVLILAMIVLVVQTFCKTYIKIHNSEKAIGKLLVIEDDDEKTYVFAEFTTELDVLKDGDAVTLIVDKHTHARKTTTLMKTDK